ncbi:ABC transporter ATP-binding protein [Mammaliicoccus sciuri]|uniref:ABC transporter ATP-binding protein n=1 Tax=Mammaliicoccus sciuri TaxID=1296 RepID=UPI000D1F384C|nr:ABC transporter ATP-binding protein [Mammaliicoccus sciuri]MCE5040993.1 ABC transporter ATP-binding protein [Mammaliicoccus sciuri]MCE5057357.1 ABC transporter ATP-binding protein [Mammaliicoccus sciuri]MDT0711738.1 ABC transporter ATP-binding protein [Mammaliicoccus sciuri]PTJ47683.1 glycine/betaine ABC transporter ATP-binding protein [Mammaliicoccus sciuri]RIN91656.1 ABC transporter ATP-binding protein [Mammaliicoccus sciuri]
MIKFEAVSKIYGDKKAVDNVSFNINEGEFFVLIGPSGCGKTTTLKMINRLIPLSEGFIYFNDKPISDYDVAEMRWDIGYVLQQIALFPHMTIKENIAQVPEMKKWKKKDIAYRVDELLTMVGLDPETYRDRYPSELSGGQQQRIGVIRALASDPPVVLMDEPFSALDPISRKNLQDDLLELQSQIKKTIVFVTHDIEEAMKMGDRICLLNQGHVEQIGTTEDFIHRPKNDFVKSFIGNVDAHVLKQVKLGDIAQPISDVNTQSIDQYPKVSPDQTIDDIYGLLAEHEAIVMDSENTAPSHIVTRQYVFSYLAEKNRGVSS